MLATARRTRRPCGHEANTDWDPSQEDAMTLTILDPRSGQRVTITVPDGPPPLEAVMKQSSMGRAQHRLFRQLGEAT
jgi:hypothetical protein